MKTACFLTFLAILAAVPVVAQDQSGSVAITGSIRPSGDSATVMNSAMCVVELKKSGTADKEARNFCAKIADREMKASENIANEAADAAQAGKPTVVADWGRSAYYGGGHYSRPLVVERAPRRHVPRYHERRISRGR